MFSILCHPCSQDYLVGTSTLLHAFCKERQQRKVVSFWKFSDICGSASKISAGLRKNLGLLKAIKSGLMDKTTLMESVATVQQTCNLTRLVFNPVCVGGGVLLRFSECLVGLWGSVLQTLTLFHTIICHFLYPF